MQQPGHKPGCCYFTNTGKIRYTILEVRIIFTPPGSTMKLQVSILLLKTNIKT